MDTISMLLHEMYASEKDVDSGSQTGSEISQCWSAMLLANVVGSSSRICQVAPTTQERATSHWDASGHL